MSTRTLFFSCEPGGAEVLIPVVQLLQRQPDFDVHVAGYGHGRDRFLAKGVACQEIAPVRTGELSLLQEHRPDVLITSCASLPDRDKSERHLWLGARQLHIPSIAFLDQWQNYVLRFSGTTPESRLRFLPDSINCLDDIGEREMLAEGFDPGRLRKFGHPYLSALPELLAAISRDKVAGRLGLAEGEKVVLFVSEAIREHFGRSRGYDQHDALELFFSLVGKGSWTGRPLVKLHPKDDPGEYADAIQRHADLRPLLVTNELTSLECIKVASGVFGMSSVMLVEAYALGLPVVSLQPGLKEPDPFILSHLGIVPLATSATVPPVVPAAPDQSFSWVFRADAFLSFLDDLLSGKRVT